MNEQTAAEYVVRLKEAGYTPETDSYDGEVILFKGFNSSGDGVVFEYYELYENGIISYGAKDALTGC